MKSCEQVGHHISVRGKDRCLACGEDVSGAIDDLTLEQRLRGSVGVMRGRLIRDAARRVEIARARCERLRHVGSPDAERVYLDALEAWFDLTVKDYAEDGE